MTNDEIRSEIRKRREEIRALDAQATQIKRDIAQLKSQFDTEWKVGERYETAKGRFEFKYLAVDDEGRIEQYNSKVAKIRKDGTPGDVLQYPYGLEDARRIV